MIAVLFQPDTGVIVQSMTGAEASIAASARVLGCDWIAVDVPRDDYDAAFVVVDGKLVPR